MQKNKLLLRLSAYCFLVLIPILLLIILEFFFSTFYYFTNSKYLETYIETLSRRPRDNIEYNSFLREELKGDKLKIAVFGGSSSAGYGVPYSFSSLLSQTLPNDLIVHKYAENGAPFAGFQAEILKKVSKFYDILIIYAGHNEIIGHLHRNYNETKEKQFWPDGHEIPSKESMITHNKKIELLDEIFYPKKFGETGYLKSQFKSFFNQIYFYSRLSNFVRRVLYKIKISNNEKQIKHRTEMPIVANKPFINLSNQMKFIANYSSSISELINNLSQNQKVILSTVLVNDIYPPFLDYKNVVGSEDIKIYNKKILKLYKYLENNNYKEIKDKTTLLDDGAHKSYFKASLCRNKDFSNSRCLDLAKDARLKDSMPLRVVPGINSFIKKIKNSNNKNIYFIDPMKIINKSKSKEEYMSYFIDFQHPSSKGQALIANEILKILFPKKNISITIDNGLCDKFLIKFDQNLKILMPSNEEKSYAYVENSNWLKRNILTSKIKFFSQYYLNKANLKFESCK